MSRWVVWLDEYERVVRVKVSGSEVADVVKRVMDDDDVVSDVVMVEGEIGEEGSIGDVYDELGIGDRGILICSVVKYRGKEVVVEYEVRWFSCEE